MKAKRGIHPLAAILVPLALAAVAIYVFELPPERSMIVMVSAVVAGLCALYYDRRPRMASVDAPPTRYYYPGSALERLTTAVLPDGNVVVYPYPFLREGYVVTPEQFARYRDWQAGRLTARALKRWIYVALFVVIAGFTTSALIRPQDPMRYFPNVMLGAPVVIAVLGFVWGWLPSRREFHRRFPQAVRRARDPNQGRKRLLYLMTRPGADIWFCGFFAIAGSGALWIGGPIAWDSVAAGKSSALDIVSYVVWFVALPLFILFHAFLAWQHVAFRLRHHRAPAEADIA